MNKRKRQLREARSAIKSLDVAYTGQSVALDYLRQSVARQEAATRALIVKVGELEDRLNRHAKRMDAIELRAKPHG